ncbi:hypothetical protein HK405_013613 [Cladochytrium tenue]|nr:hypothetical protein HK405_013613 [Cladochytrium tenue]
MARPQLPSFRETTEIYERRAGSDVINERPSFWPPTAEGKINQYIILHQIGRGSFGRVLLCQDETDGRHYACKILSKSRLVKSARPMRWGAKDGGPSPNVQDLMHSVKREIAILKKISRHPYISALVEVLDDANDDNLYMVFELCEYGPVMVISPTQRARPFCETHARKYFREMVLGIEYLHHRGIVHRDLKPENILVTSSREIRIADFGISHDCEGVSDVLPDKNMTLSFTPPEAWRCGGLLYGKAADIWSLGVTLFALVHGRLPFGDAEEAGAECGPLELGDQVAEREPEMDPGLSDSLRQLLAALLHKDPELRPQARSLRGFSWASDGGRWPLVPSEEENCGGQYVAMSVGAPTVTEEDVEKAFSPVTALFSKIRASFQKLALVG